MDPMQSGSQNADRPADELAIYYKVFGALVALTALTVFAGYLPDWIRGFPEGLTVIIAVTIAATKATLVALYFMHLRMESRNIYIVAGVPLMLAIILLIALGPDIAGFGRPVAG